jgi:type I restriction enzyme M protein
LKKVKKFDGNGEHKVAERVIDYISGIEVPATPEEIEATQVFSKLLVEDYGYPKEHIQTRPQFRVKVRPSDTKKEYPVDIAVFSDPRWCRQ